MPQVQTGKMNSMSFFKTRLMKELNTKIGVFLTTYTQDEIDDRIKQLMDDDNSVDCNLFMDNLRSFNPKSSYYITEKESKKLVGIEKRKSKINPQDMYTNYKGAPFGIVINEAKLYFSDPLLSLRSAFDSPLIKFNFEKDFFHIRIVK